MEQGRINHFDESERRALNSKPWGIYTRTNTLVHVGIYYDEADIWRVFLGWPDLAEIKEAKEQRGLRASEVSVTEIKPGE